jgi:hypothetical protein
MPIKVKRHCEHPLKEGLCENEHERSALSESDDSNQHVIA